MKARLLATALCFCILNNSQADINWNPVWDPYDPLKVAEFSYPEGGPYRIVSPPTPNPLLGPARAALVDQGSAGTTDFCYVIDIIGFDDSMTQAFGIIARGNNFDNDSDLLPTGYVLNLNFNGHLVLNILEDNNITEIARSSYGEMNPYGRYRLIFYGIGNLLGGELYDLNVSSSQPVASINTTDPNNTYQSGYVALFGYADGNDNGIDVTFSPSQVPEPGIYAVGAGLVVLLTSFLKRRRTPLVG